MKLSVITKLPLSLRVAIVNRSLSIKRIDKLSKKFSNICEINKCLDDAKYVIFSPYAEKKGKHSRSYDSTLVFINKDSEIVGYIKGKNSVVFDIIKH